MALNIPAYGPISGRPESAPVGTRYVAEDENDKVYIYDNGEWSEYPGGNLAAEVALLADEIIILAAKVEALEDAVYRTVTFDADGGTPEPAPQRVPVGGLATAPEDPTKDGFTFEGWEVDGDPFDFDSPIYVDLTLTASWAS